MRYHYDLPALPRGPEMRHQFIKYGLWVEILFRLVDD